MMIVKNAIIELIPWCMSSANSLENQEFQSIACLGVVSFPEFDLKVDTSYLHSLLVKGATAMKEKLCS